jgi:hypothetical protein
MSTSVLLPVTLEDKAKLMAARSAEVRAIEATAGKHAILHGGEEPPPSCFGRLATCVVPFRAKMVRVATAETAATTTATVEEKMKGATSSSLLNRVVGKKKKAATVSLSTAMTDVAQRVEALQDRVRLARERAMAASKVGQKESALKEMKRAKQAEKQLAVAQQALAALEQQENLLAESQLHSELTQILASTTATVKGKTHGLVAKAEAATDGAIEVRDDMEDVAQVFDGLTPQLDADDDDLLAELHEMIGENATESTPAPATSASPASTHATLPFPSAPTGAVGAVSVGAVDVDL